MTQPELPITLNGKPHVLPAPSSLQDLLQSLDIPPAQGGVAIAVGMRVIPRSSWATTHLKANDEVEIIRATAGG